jgi:hypothetical protein
MHWDLRGRQDERRLRGFGGGKRVGLARSGQPEPPEHEARRHQRTWNWLARMPLKFGGLPVGLVMT